MFRTFVYSTKIFLLVASFQHLAYSQSLEKIAKLDSRLKEISGLTFLNDTVLIAHNDSGNEAVLYFLDLKGKIIHQTLVSNAKNVDWEDISTNGKGTIFIADIGNNANKRKNLKIYCVASDSILYKEETEAKIIELSYEDQKEFPPSHEQLHYDAEALSFYNDSLYIFTKSHSKPFDGLTSCYKLPAKPGTYMLKAIQVIQLKERHESFDSVSAAEILGDKCYLLTYSGIEVFSLNKNPGIQETFSHEKRISFLKLTQKEALTVNKDFIYIADEHNKTLGGKNLYKLQNK